MRSRAGLLVGLLVLASGVSAQAADMSRPLPASPRSAPAESAWVVSIGGDGRLQPRYTGSNAWSVAPVPYFDMARPGSPEKFHSPRDGVGFPIYDNNAIAVGPVASWIWTRNQSLSSSLNGLGDVDFTFMAGGFADLWVVPWLRTRLEVMQSFGGATGVVANLAMDAVLPVTPALTWSGGPRARYVTSGLESPYFSITQAQSINSGLPVYNAGSGFQAVGAGTQLKYRFNPTWATYGFLEYDRLVGPTANSPIVTGPGGNANQWTLGLGVIYSFTVTGLPF
jgi:outer membrane protein